MRLVLLAAALIVLWQTAGVLLLVFAACLFAVVLNALASQICRLSPLPYAAALALTILVLAGVLAASVAVLGVQIHGDFTFLLSEIPKTLDRELRHLGIDMAAIDLNSQFAASDWGGVLGGLANSAGAALTGVTNVALVVIGGIFLAARPTTYRMIALYLFPRRMCPKVMSVLDNLGSALRNWLLGKILLMLGIGVVTTLGLMLIGVESALGLGLLAGLLEFIPIVGPILAAIPALVVGFSNGFETGMWTLLLYLGVQQIESNLVVPLVQRRTVDLPPALGLCAIMVFGVWFGPVGIMLSAPLAVCVEVLVVQLYARDVLGWDVAIPGTGRAGKADVAEPEA